MTWTGHINTMIATIVGGLLLLVAIYYLRIRTSALYAIPGLMPLPFIGNLHVLSAGKPHLTIHKLSKDIGAVFRLTFFGTTNVVVSDPDSVYEVLVKKSKDFAGRSQTFRILYASDNGSGILLTDMNPMLKAKRKLVQQYLKMHGSGMKKIEEVTNDAADDMLKQIEGLCGKPVNPRKILVRCVIDVIMIMLTGQTVESEEAVADIFQCIEDGVVAMTPSISGEALDMIPLLRYFGIGSFRLIKEVVTYRNKTVRAWQSSNPSNGFLHHLHNLLDEDKKKHGISEELAQINVIWEFLSGGIYTTSATLTTLMNVLAQRPAVQLRLREEAINILGSSKSPRVADRENMPYHRATLYEIGRFASILPLGVPHKAVRDTTIAGYAIPKGTAVLPNLWTLHHDENLWDEPFDFKPERFLAEDGQLHPADHPNRKNLMPFGAGERVCVGEVLAMSRMFLIVSRLVQNFEILPGTTLEEQPSMDPRDMKMGFAVIPPECTVRFKAL